MLSFSSGTQVQRHNYTTPGLRARSNPTWRDLHAQLNLRRSGATERSSTYVLLSSGWRPSESLPLLLPRNMCSLRNLCRACWDTQKFVDQNADTFNGLQWMSRHDRSENHGSSDHRTTPILLSISQITLGVSLVCTPPRRSGSPSSSPNGRSSDNISTRLWNSRLSPSISCRFCLNLLPISVLHPASITPVPMNSPCRRKLSVPHPLSVSVEVVDLPLYLLLLLSAGRPQPVQASDYCFDFSILQFAPMGIEPLFALGVQRSKGSLTRTGQVL